MYEIICPTVPQINYTMHDSRGWMHKEMLLQVTCLNDTHWEGNVIICFVISHPNHYVFSNIIEMIRN